MRGTPAAGRVGPDLTHVASRLTLGAALLDNNEGNMGGWIANPQAVKPGVRMPHVPLPAEDFNAVLRYMRTLR